MRWKKRVTAVVLCMSMVLSGSGISAFAAQAETATGTPQRTETDIRCSERKQKFNDNWKFQLVNKYDIHDDSVQAQGEDYDDSGWDTVTLPHDWAIYQEFESSNGVRAAQGALPGGVGWYRKSFTLSEEDFKEKKVSLAFDGVYMISQVWVNGQTREEWKQYLGYTTFTYDITDFLYFDGRENTVAVKVQSGNDTARWYAGAGIYRNVWLISTEKMHVPVDGVTVTTPLEKLSPATGKYEAVKDPQKAGVDLQTKVANDADTDGTVSVRSTIYDKTGDVASAQTEDVTVGAGEVWTAQQTIEVANPKLWSTESPNLYWVRTEVLADGKVVDTVDTRFGIRYLALDANSGFYLNGVRTKLNGVCEHSDLGALGMEVYEAAIDRRIRKLKSFGCNAVRTAHNPVSPEYIEACDRLGFLVFEEAFDQWLYSKNNGDYSHYFNKAYDGQTVVFDRNGDSIEIKRPDLVSNAERDIKAMVSRDKNSPAVFAWSTGNEIYDAREKHGMDTLANLTGWIKEVDVTRPVAACPPTWDSYSKNDYQQEKHLAAAELSGFNYAQGQYDRAHTNYPGMVIFGSETASAFYNRGIYTVGGRRDPSEYPTAWNFSSGSYSIIEHRDKTYTAGEFVWTGHDYLGEPTPMGGTAKSSCFGIVDTAGFEKDAFYMYKSMWTDIPTVHILPQNWNYKTGDKVPVYIYTNAASVELFLNGKSLGVKNFDKKTSSDAYIKWTDGLEYQAGELKAVARDGADGTGNVIAEDVVYTAGAAQKIELSADRAFIKNDGRDLVYVEATVTDSAGIQVPDAEHEITFQVNGGEIVAVDNGNPYDRDPYRGVDTRHAYSGKALVIVKADEGSVQDITVTATAESSSGKLSSNTITVEAKDELDGDGTDEPEFVSTELTMGKGVSVDEVLPSQVQMLYSNGVLARFSVTGWNLDALDLGTPGEYIVKGTADGIDGEFECKIIVKEIQKVEEVAVTTLVHVAPPLPKFVTLTYADGTIGAAAVSWDAVSQEQYASAGSFQVSGSIGPNLAVTANVAVKEVQAVEEITLETTIGVIPQLPAGVKVTFTDGTAEEIGVDWEIGRDTVSVAGTTKITGKILGSDVKASAALTVKYAAYASDLAWVSAVQETGTPVKDQTVGGSKLKARVDQGGPPTPYEKGIGTLADAEIVYDIAGKGYESFCSNISLGFDYGQGALGAVVFKVYVDDEAEPRYTSPVMTHASKNIPIDVDVRDARRVRLVTEVASNDAPAEYYVADWCDAKFVSGHVAVMRTMQRENFFYYTEAGQVPKLFESVQAETKDGQTARFYVEWPDLTAEMFARPDVIEVEGTVTGTVDGKVKAKVIVDLTNAMLDTKVSEKVGTYSIDEVFDYVPAQGAKVKINTMESIREDSALIYQWTDNMLIENCTHNAYGFNYGVYPDPNNANPEYLILRAPAMKSFTVRGTAQDSTHANQNFTFYTSSDGVGWTEFADYQKTEDASREGWPSRLYTAQELPESTHYLKIAYPSGNTWQFNLNEVHIEGGETAPEDGSTIGLHTNGGTLPAGVKNKIFVKRQETVGELPVPERLRYTFKGWFTEKEGGEEVTASYVPQESMVIYARWERNAPGTEDTVSYFVDCGASAFTDAGWAFMDAYSDTVKNSSPDQAYTKESGWGYTNDASVVDVNGNGDAYTTIRHFKAKMNGLTMSYRFALEAGTYDVITGFYDPWSKWAGDDRHTQVTVEDLAGSVLAQKEDYKISGNKEYVSLTDVEILSDSDITLNLKPLKSVPNNLDSCDVLVSFIVIIRKAGSVVEEPDVKQRLGLKTAIAFAQALDEEEYTAQSYQALVAAIEAAQEIYASEDVSKEEMQAQIENLAAAVRGLKGALREANEQLAAQLAEKENALRKKRMDLILTNTEAAELERQLREARAELDGLEEKEPGQEEQIRKLTEEIAALDGQLESVRAKEKLLAAEEESLQRQVEEIRIARKKAQDDAAKKKAEQEEALKKAKEEEERLKEELRRLQEMKLKKGDSVTVKGIRYRVTDEKAKTAEAYGMEDKSLGKITVAAAVTIKGISCKVTAVAAGAFAGAKKAKQAVVGKNVTKIGKKAFRGDKKLVKITVKSKKLKSVGKQSLKGISAKAVIKVPKAKKKAYTKLFKNKGQKKSVKIK